MAVKKKYNHNVLGRGLDDIGRGLDALIDTHSEVKTEGSSNLNEIDIAQIEPNPNQPRREFDTDALQELATSIRTGHHTAHHPPQGGRTEIPDHSR
jgi:ParB family chromosome partitioning protein